MEYEKHNLIYPEETGLCRKCGQPIEEKCKRFYCSVKCREEDRRSYSDMWEKPLQNKDKVIPINACAD